MGRLSRRYEREAAEWSAAVLQMIAAFAVVAAVGAVIVSAALVLIAWGLLGTLIWLVGWPVALVSKSTGRQVRAAGERQMRAMETAADEWTHPRRTKQRQQTAALAAQAATEARIRNERAAALAVQAATEARERDERAAREAPILAARAVAEAEAQAVAQREWLEGPPPPLQVPTRFSETWFANHVPKLHPGQMPALTSELRARGWNDQRIM